MTLSSAARKSATVAIRAGGCLPLSAWAKAGRCAPETRMTPMPPRPGAVAMAAIVSTVRPGSDLGVVGGFAGTLYRPRDLPLLGNGERVVDHPVEHQTGREEEEHAAEDEG